MRPSAMRSARLVVAPVGLCPFGAVPVRRSDGQRLPRLPRAKAGEHPVAKNRLNNRVRASAERAALAERKLIHIVPVKDVDRLRGNCSVIVFAISDPRFRHRSDFRSQLDQKNLAERAIGFGAQASKPTVNVICFS